MSKIDELAKTIIDSAEIKEKKKTSPYDTTAKVLKVEGGIAWVNIAGGVDQTPARMVVDAKAGDEVMVRVGGGNAYVTGNVSAPPTDDTYAKRAEAQAIRATRAADAATESAGVAQKSADSASRDAARANASAESAIEDAATAKEAADTASADAAEANAAATQAISDAADAADAASAAAQAAATADAKATAAGTAAQAAQTSANNAQTSANEAKASATNASEYAARALGNLSTVQNVAETLNWITTHGTMTLTTDQALDPTHVYFVVDASGDYVVGGTHYSVVSEPDVADIATYYELSIDESLNNYVATHLAVDSEGLWIIPDAGGNKVLISTGQGTAYPNAGTFIIGKINGVDTVLASFGVNGAQIGAVGEARLDLSTSGIAGYSNQNNAFFKVDQNAGTSTYYANDSVGTTWNPDTGDYNLDAINLSDEGEKSFIYRKRFIVTPTGTLGISDFIIQVRFESGDVLVDEGTVETENATYSINSNNWLIVNDDNTTPSISFNEDYDFNAFVKGVKRRKNNKDLFFDLYINIRYVAGTDEVVWTFRYVSRNGGMTANVVNNSNYFGEWDYNAPAFTYGTRIGNTGVYSTAEGFDVEASGDYSHAQNLGTISDQFAQTVIGKYNDPKFTAFEIGNGNSDSERSNAFSVDWDGNVEAAGDVILDIDDNASSGDDYELKQALVNAGIWNDVIVQ